MFVCFFFKGKRAAGKYLIIFGLRGPKSDLISEGMAGLGIRVGHISVRRAESSGAAWISPGKQGRNVFSGERAPFVVRTGVGPE